MEAIHRQLLLDEKPENERLHMDADHWYELNLTNSYLFSNLDLIDETKQLVPGRLFTTRMPRNLQEPNQTEAKRFIEKVEKNDLKVVLTLTEPDEFVRYAGVEDLMDFYKEECGLIVYHRAIPDFDIPTEGDLVNGILELTYQLAKGRNCLIHCAGGSGRTGMVVAAIVQNFGVKEVLSKIRKVKSTYVETAEQELFLKNVPKALSKKIVKTMPNLACAIAAEQLIAVFQTHKKQLRKAEKETEKVEAMNRISSVMSGLDDKHVQKLKEAYGEIFDIIDHDKSGLIDTEEMSNFFEIVSAQIDVEDLKETLFGSKQEGSSGLTRENFTDIMSKKIKHHVRGYDLGAA